MHALQQPGRYRRERKREREKKMVENYSLPGEVERCSYVRVPCTGYSRTATLVGLSTRINSPPPDAGRRRRP
jgi:hypothetical protein